MLLGAFGLAFVLAGVALGDGVILNGLSARSIGRGGTDLAWSDNGAILYDNPAGAVNIDGQQMFDVGLDILVTDFYYSDPLNSAQDSGVFPLPQVALIRKSDDGCWAYGIGFFVPAGFSESYNLSDRSPSTASSTTSRGAAWHKCCPRSLTASMTAFR